MLGTEGIVPRCKKSGVPHRSPESLRISSSWGRRGRNVVWWALTELASAPSFWELETSPLSGQSLAGLRSDQSELSLACKKGDPSPRGVVINPENNFLCLLWHHPGRINPRSDFQKRQDAEDPSHLRYKHTNPNSQQST